MCTTSATQVKNRPDAFTVTSAKVQNNINTVAMEMVTNDLQGFPWKSCLDKNE